MYPLLLLALLASTAAVAQSACPPVVKAWSNNQPVPAKGAPFAGKLRLRVSSAPGCPANVRYYFKEAQVTPMRGPLPLTPTRIMTDSTGDVTWMGQHTKPGDRLYVFIPYDQLMMVAADGKRTPYPVPAGEAGKGISFDWVLLKP
ncbi:hypothetical protein LJY25_15165 [Hymenobacter sp. BT175]|uniref:hypothetical protein n=1 Tax=Hymenobacter translucens TaxID=2886507 RepID=UPI001D0EA9BC|nr:hypothetical protein [Hymenobacter translucens]MCC2547790.1 hypothetical protein [Hymenobacter translucens]